MQMMFADNICYACTTAAIKTAIVLLYRRIFITPAFKRITLALLVILAMWWISVFFTQISFCTPVSSFWVVAEREHCIDSTMFYNAVTISNVIIDFTLLILPMPMVWSLHMDVRRKVQVSGVFLLGGL